MVKVHSNFNGLVLAGGQSSRMGQDKALLQCPDGETLLQRATGLLVSTGAKRVYVSSHNQQVANAVNDDFPHRGPVSGIHAALRVSEQAPLLVLPVDMPLMQSSLLQELVHTGFAQQKACCFVDQCLPLYIHDPNTAMEQAIALLSDKQNVSVWRFIHSIDGVELETPEKQMFKNANDPTQWQECQSLMTLGQSQLSNIKS